MGEIILRFVVGGVIVSAFAAIAEIFKPKSFAGLFSAAPSIALATLGITISHHGKAYAAVETHSMVLGAIAFFCYASTACWLLMRIKMRALIATIILIPVWLGSSFGLWWVLER